MQKAKDDTLRVVVLGGSVAACHGVDDRQDCWVSLLLKWMHDHLGHNVHLTNSAVPASTSALTAQCIEDLVHPNTDIVLVFVAIMVQILVLT